MPQGKTDQTSVSLPISAGGNQKADVRYQNRYLKRAVSIRLELLATDY